MNNTGEHSADEDLLMTKPELIPLKLSLRLLQQNLCSTLWSLFVNLTDMKAGIDWALANVEHLSSFLLLKDCY